MHALYIVLPALCILAIAYRYYSAFIATRIWMLDDSGKPKAVDVRIGLADGTYSELVGGELKEGTQVIVGTQADAKGRAQQTKGGPRFGF